MVDQSPLCTPWGAGDRMRAGTAEWTAKPLTGAVPILATVPPRRRTFTRMGSTATT